MFIYLSVKKLHNPFNFHLKVLIKYWNTFVLNVWFTYILFYLKGQFNQIAKKSIVLLAIIQN